jgi:hypothetical protein
MSDPKVSQPKMSLGQLTFALLITSGALGCAVGSLTTAWDNRTFRAAEAREKWATFQTQAASYAQYCISVFAAFDTDTRNDFLNPGLHKSFTYNQIVAIFEKLHPDNNLNTFQTALHICAHKGEDLRSASFTDTDQDVARARANIIYLQSGVYYFFDNWRRNIVEGSMMCGFFPQSKIAEDDAKRPDPRDSAARWFLKTRGYCKRDGLTWQKRAMNFLIRIKRTYLF